MENLLIQNDLEEQREEFKIEDLEGASWAFRKLRAISKKEDEIKKYAEEETKRINEWLDKQLKSYESERGYFEGLLTEYYIKGKREDKKFKLSTPYGKVNSRKTTTWFYEDEDQLKSYIKENNIPAIKIKESIDKNNLKKIFKNGIDKETGEILPFVRVEETENITVRVEE